MLALRLTDKIIHGTYWKLPGKFRGISFTYISNIFENTYVENSSTISVLWSQKSRKDSKYYALPE